MNFISPIKLRPKGKTMYFNTDTIVFKDGAFIPVREVEESILFSQTLHYGFGLFEGMRSYQTPDGPKIFKALEHYERMAQSAKRLKLPLPYSPEQLKSFSYQLLTHNDLSDAYIRPLLYTAPNMSLNATSEAHILIMAWKWGRLLGDNLVNLMVSDFTKGSFPPDLIDMKVSGLYVNNIMAASDARNKGFHDALLLDQDGYVAQASGSNIFMEIDEVLYTPPQGHILPGITRRTVFQLAKSMGIPVVEKNFTPEELYQADGAFLVGTATEIAGIAKVNGNPFKMRWEDTTGFILSRKYRQLVTRSEKSGGTLI
jgi:branched-chain amino acid aminotransferase